MSSQSTFADISPQAGQGLRTPPDIGLSFLRWVFTWNYYRWRCPKCSCRVQQLTFDASPEEETVLNILDAPFCPKCASTHADYQCCTL